MNKNKIVLNKSVLSSIFLLMLWGLLAPKSAHAYIDPGTGAFFWQLLLAALFGAMFFIRRIWLWFRGVVNWLRHICKIL